MSATYTLLIYASQPAKPLTEAEQTMALQRHRALQAELDAHGDLMSVARLDEPSSAKTVRSTDGATRILDGPYVESKEWLVGLYLIECANEDVALERARLICSRNDICVEVRPVTWRRSP
ncbi:MAG: YciI family protein [Deltaproteobacteria bacterium]|nr:YciI family protein [Deltaproteobacteria bacterium]